MSVFPGFNPSYDGDTPPTPLSVVVESAYVYPLIKEYGYYHLSSGETLLQPKLVVFCKSTTKRYIFRSMDEAVVWLTATYGDLHNKSMQVTAERYNDAGWAEIVIEQHEETTEEYEPPN